jgi:hypothetical protein
LDNSFHEVYPLATSSTLGTERSRETMDLK